MKPFNFFNLPLPSWEKKKQPPFPKRCALSATGDGKSRATLKQINFSRQSCR